MSRPADSGVTGKVGRAESAKAEGNKLYIASDFLGAMDYYEKAFDLNPLPVYLSNLSAAQYELGRYEDALRTIRKALQLLKEAPSDELRPKLLLRALKANIYLQKLDEATFNINTIVDTCSGTSSGMLKNVKEIETMLKEIQSTTAAFSADEARWKRRLLQLPRYRNAPRRYIEYYVTGQDDACSILGAQELDQRNDIIEAERVRMEIPADATPFDFSALFGGIGDARNLYGTLSDIAGQLESRDNRPGRVRIHFTLVDILPTVLARDLVVIFTLAEIAGMDEGAIEKSPKTRQLLLMLHYVFWALLMPPSLHKLLWSRIRSLHQEFSKAAARGSAVQRPWLYVDPETVSVIKDSLAWWLGDGPKVYTVEKVLELDTDMSDVVRDPATVAALAKINEEKKAEFEQGLSDPRVVAMVQESADKIGLPYDEYVERMKKVAYEGDIAENMRIIDSTLPGCLAERRAYRHTKICFPPVDVDEPSIFMQAVKIIQIHDDLTQEHKELCYHVIEERVLEGWKVNVTFFDRGKEGTFAGTDIFSNTFTFFKSRHLVDPTVHERTCLADWMAAFFSRAAEGIRRLLHLGEDALMLEVVAGDVWQVMEEINYDVADRPEAFPKAFDRLHFNNVPDYTGGHATLFTVGRALLKPHPQAYIANNCMLNTNLWGSGFGGNFEKNLDAFIYHYIPAVRTEIPALFALDLASKPEMLAVYMTWVATVPSATPYATREQLLRIIHGLFLRCVVPAPYRYPQKTTMEPRDVINVHAVFRLLMFLGTRHPAHVLGEFVASVLENRLVTQVPVHASSPISVPNKSTPAPNMPLCCTPFHAEFEVAAALWRPLLPFPILCHVPAVTDIGIYSIAFKSLPERVIDNLPSSHHTLIAVIGKKTELENAAFVMGLRKSIQGNRKLKTSFTLISTFNWDIDANVAHIPLTRERFEAFSSSSCHIVIVNSIFWTTVSSAEPCSTLRLTGDLDSQTPAPSLWAQLKPVGDVPYDSGMSIMTAMGYGPPTGGLGQGGMGGMMMASLVKAMRDAGLADRMPPMPPGMAEELGLEDM